MNRRYSIIIGILILVIIGQGYFLNKSKAQLLNKKEEDLFENDFGNIHNPSDLIDKLRKKFKHDDDSARDISENFFDDNFFARYEDPFKEMEEWRKKIFKNFESNNSSLFNNSWDNWYKNKFGDLDVSTVNEKDKVIMEFVIPGLQSNTLNIDITDKRIKLEGEIEQIREERDDKGISSYRSSSYRHFSRILPIPEHVDAAKAQIKTEGEKLIITFPKKKV
jgi:HSP20 family molecular chaperone IbpA